MNEMPKGAPGSVIQGSERDGPSGAHADGEATPAAPAGDAYYRYAEDDQ